MALPVSSFYEACAPLIEQTLQAMEPLFARQELIEGTGNLPGVAGVYVVGGSERTASRRKDTAPPLRPTRTSITLSVGGRDFPG